MQESATNPFEGPGYDDQTAGAGRSWLKSCLLMLLLAGGALLVLTLLLLPSVRSTPQSARRTQCKNNMKQIMLAIANYQDVYGQTPPLHTVSDRGLPLHSWRTLLLPFVEEQALYDRIDLSVPWNDPANAAFAEQMPACFWCPSADLISGQTLYVASTSARPRLPSLHAYNSPGLEHESDRLLIYEVPIADAVPWMAPDFTDNDAFMSIAPSDETAHHGGGHIVTTSGRTTFFSSQNSPAERQALLEPVDHKIEATATESKGTKTSEFPAEDELN